MAQKADATANHTVQREALHTDRACAIAAPASMPGSCAGDGAGAPMYPRAGVIVAPSRHSAMGGDRIEPTRSLSRYVGNRTQGSVFGPLHAVGEDRAPPAPASPPTPPPMAG